ncbi:hypothetical protein EXIGLDRAFT_131173 [Exidia glandulosa HHB12029]|uniref:Membrane anchor Opy2 N-terminal domain-containing protein n=1 Tax=Exidia glandulosa HHB12029 TaxID=1314781 RepID=A0A165G4R2_EXIGL|nr:hypothetical protein EXIGLDRAFT_131173 [Exidia glandulosa HHB12029]
MLHRRQDWVDIATCAIPACTCSDTQYCLQTPYLCNQCPTAVCHDIDDSPAGLRLAAVGGLGAGIIGLIVLIIGIYIRVRQKRQQRRAREGRPVPYLFRVAARNAIVNGTPSPTPGGPVANTDSTLVALRKENDQLRNALSWLQNQLAAATTESETHDTRRFPRIEVKRCQQPQWFRTKKAFARRTNVCEGRRHTFATEWRRLAEHHHMSPTRAPTLKAFCFDYERIVRLSQEWCTLRRKMLLLYGATHALSPSI